MQIGDVVVLTQDTNYYKKGTKAVIMNVCEGRSDFEIRYENEKYFGEDVDLMPKSLFKILTV